MAETLHNCHTVLAKSFKIWHQIKFWEAIVSFPLNLMAYWYSIRQQYKIKATVRKLERHLSKAVSVGKISITNSFKSCSLKLKLSIHIWHYGWLAYQTPTRLAEHSEDRWAPANLGWSLCEKHILIGSLNPEKTSYCVPKYGHNYLILSLRVWGWVKYVSAWKWHFVYQ